jgi:hypothetical protein
LTITIRSAIILERKAAMQDADRIGHFIRGFPTLKDPPFLPVALWFGVMPLLRERGYVSDGWAGVTFLLANVMTVIGVRWFRRSYGVVTLERQEPSAGLKVAALISVFVLEVVSTAARLPVRLGLLAVAVFLAWGGWMNGGLRRHLYVLSVICGILAVLPGLSGVLLPGLRADGRQLGVVMITAFGLGWAYVCVQDYRVLTRGFSNGRP